MSIPFIFEDGKVLTAEQLNELQNPVCYKSNGYVYHNSLSFENGDVLSADEMNRLQEQMLVANNYYVHASSNPKSQGIVNAIKRAKQFTDVIWTAKKDIPASIMVNNNYTTHRFYAGRTYRGVIYSGQQASYFQYCGLNSNLDTFVTSTCDDKSKLYTQWNDNNKGGAFYGTVCSKFAQYVYDMKTAYSTSAMGTVPGVSIKATTNKYSAEDVELLDMLVDLDWHTAVVTDILYDDSGEICFIEISEAMPPTCRRWLWDMESFKKEWIPYYNLYKYAYLDRIPYIQNQYVNVDNETGAIVVRDFIIMPEYGDKFNYSPSNTKQTCHILNNNHSYTKAIVKRDGNIIDTINITNETTSFKFDISRVGYLEMYLEDNNGNKSHSVYGCVVSATVSIVDSSEFNQGKLTISWNGSSGKAIFAAATAKSMGNCIMLDRENDQVIPVNENSATILFKSWDKTINVAFENEYGIYFSSTTSFTPKENGTHENENDDSLLSKGSYWENYLVSNTNGTINVTNGYNTYKNVPIEGNVKYNAVGASSIYFYTHDFKAISGMSLASSTEFTTPQNAAFAHISYDSAKINNFNESLIRIEAIGAISDILLKDSGAIFKEKTNLNSSSYEQVTKDGYFAYIEIPVEGSTTYYVRGGTRSWYLDDSKKSLSTANIKNGTVPFKFTTPATAKYISIAFASDDCKSDANSVRLIKY